MQESRTQKSRVEEMTHSGPSVTGVYLVGWLDSPQQYYFGCLCQVCGFFQ
jgi:hypothetical protein